MPDDSIQPDDAADLPVRLKEELSALYGSPLRVEAATDRLILSAARAGVAWRKRQHRAVFRWVGAGAAAAAVIAIALRLTLVHPYSQHNPTGSPVAMAGDINHDGKIDVLDAFVVAKAIHNGAKLDPAWDVNHDGVVDQKDVDLIAAMAVSLRPEGVK